MSKSHAGARPSSGHVLEPAFCTTFRLPIRANACIYLHALFPRICSPSRKCLSLPDVNDITCISGSDNTTRPHDNVLIITNIDDTLLHIYSDYTATTPQSRHQKRKVRLFRQPSKQNFCLSSQFRADVSRTQYPCSASCPACSSSTSQHQEWP
jgi:hypothetical protein